MPTTVRRKGSGSFADWLAASRYRGSVTAFARTNGLPRTTVQSWARGGGIGPAHGARLRAITGLAFDASGAGGDSALRTRTRRVGRLVRQLGRELAPFTGDDIRRRELLRAGLDARVTHRVANLLLLLLDERRYVEYRDLNRALARGR